MAAVNGTDKVIDINITLPFETDGTISLYEDGKSIEEVRLTNETKAQMVKKRLSVKPNGGLVMVGK